MPVRDRQPHRYGSLPVDSAIRRPQPSHRTLEAIYHFAFVEPVIRVATRAEKTGNRFERLILHAFMVKTEKVVEYPECTETPVVKNKVEVTENRIEVWIYGSAGCVQTSTSQIALR